MSVVVEVLFWLAVEFNGLGQEVERCSRMVLVDGLVHVVLVLACGRYKDEILTINVVACTQANVRFNDDRDLCFDVT